MQSLLLNSQINRSKLKPKTDLGSVRIMESSEKMITVDPQESLVLEPIWENPIDKFEGKLYRDYIDQHPRYSQIYLRKEVAHRLYRAANSLPRELKIVIRAGHRPLLVQQALLNQLTDSYLEKYPKASRSEALDFVRNFVSDPSIKAPPHCCGAAVDVELINSKTGELLDFGCSVNTDNELAFLHNKNITLIQKNNRMILLQTMLKSGFASNYNEWWHYSYGDQRWSWFYRKAHAIYGIIEPEL